MEIFKKEIHKGHPLIENLFLRNIKNKLIREGDPNLRSMLVVQQAVANRSAEDVGKIIQAKE